MPLRLEKMIDDDTVEESNRFLNLERDHSLRNMKGLVVIPDYFVNV